jgi:hypothetical protein
MSIHFILGEKARSCRMCNVLWGWLVRPTCRVKTIEMLAGVRVCNLRRRFQKIRVGSTSLAAKAKPVALGVNVDPFRVVHKHRGQSHGRFDLRDP